MTTYAINVTTGASTKYTGYGFNSMFKGHDGKYYGVKSDGIYLLEGPVDAYIDFGKLDGGTGKFKICPAAYARGGVSDKLRLTLSTEAGTFSYNAEASAAPEQTVRFTPGKGLKSAYFSVKLGNTNQSTFALDAFELCLVEADRRK